MFLVMLGIIVTSVAAFASQINASLKTKKKRLLPMDKFDLAPSVQPLREIIEHPSDTPDDPRDVTDGRNLKAFGSEQYQRGAAMRRNQRLQNVRSV